MRCRALLAAALLGLAPSACATRPAESTATVTFVLVRHAEKSNDDPRDPTLSDAGRARAQRLAAALRGTALTAVYATAYRRTQQTAEPSARRHRLGIVTYDAKQPAADVAAQLRQRHAAGSVLVVGHSNTVPGLAAALCGCEVADIAENEYDRLITIRIADDGRPALEQSRLP